MKRLLLYSIVLSIFAFSNSAFGQKKAPAKSNSINNFAFLDRINQHINFEYLSNDLSGIMGSPKRISVSDYIEPLADSIKRSGTSKEELLNKNHLLKIIDYYKNINAFGESRAELTTEGLPFKFLKYNNALVFFQGNLWYGYDLNSLKMSQKERYIYIIERILIPSINNFESLLSSSDVKYFAINIAYKSRDFAEESDRGSVEQITMVVPRQIVANFINSKISDDVARKSSIFFVSTKSTNGVKKLLW